MNDRFKFRVWDNEQKRYTSVKPIVLCNDWFIREIAMQDNDDGQYVIEQCTGLRDKNGLLIYEGDVVHQTVGGLTCRIVFYRGAFCGEFVGGFTSPLSGWFRPDFDEVIGHIHEVEE